MNKGDVPKEYFGVSEEDVGDDCDVGGAGVKLMEGKTRVSALSGSGSVGVVFGAG